MSAATSNPTLDPYTAKAENTNITPQQKITGELEPQLELPPS
jgi:hypothetical protein